MGAGISKAKINRKLHSLKKKNPGQNYVVLHASNGEVAIVTEEWYNLCKPRYPKSEQ